MNPVALSIMGGIILGLIALLAYALSTGANWIVAIVAIVTVALFVRWS